MTETQWLLVCCGVMAACSLVMTVLMIGVMQELRRLLKRCQALVPTCQAMARDARHTLRHLHRAVRTGYRVARQVEDAVQRVCAVGTEVADQVLSVRNRLHTFVSRLRGNHRTRAASRPSSS